MGDLPRRRTGGYRITNVRLVVTASQLLASRITKEVTLPAPPPDALTEMQVHEFVRNLVRYAEQALRILQDGESGTVRRRYPSPQYERVQILVMSADRVVGRVNGAGQVFDVRGAMVSQGSLTPPDVSTRAHPSSNGRRRPPPKKN